jgi:hypothetical protein
MIVQSTEFRKNQKKYLDLALTGVSIEVERSGVVFRLTPLGFSGRVVAAPEMEDRPVPINLHAHTAPYTVHKVVVEPTYTSDESQEA